MKLLHEVADERVLDRSYKLKDSADDLKRTEEEKTLRNFMSITPIWDHKTEKDKSIRAFLPLAVPSFMEHNKHRQEYLIFFFLSYSQCVLENFALRFSQPQNTERKIQNYDKLNHLVIQ